MRALCLKAVVSSCWTEAARTQAPRGAADVPLPAPYLLETPGDGKEGGGDPLDPKAAAARRQDYACWHREGDSTQSIAALQSVHQCIATSSSD